MVRIIYTYIGKSMYDKIMEEKKRLQRLEDKKVKSKRKRITIAIASNRLARKI